MTTRVSRGWKMAVRQLASAERGFTPGDGERFVLRGRAARDELDQLDAGDVGLDRLRRHSPLHRVGFGQALAVAVDRERHRGSLVRRGIIDADLRGEMPI